MVPGDEGDQPVDVLAELPAEARLADAGRAREHHHARGAPLGGGVEQLADGAELGVPAGQRRLETVDALRPADSGDDPGGPPQLLGLALALEGVPLRVLEADGGRGEALGGGVDEHLVRGGSGLDPRRGVDGVAGDHALVARAEGDGDLAGDDAGPGGEGVDAALGAEQPDGVDQVEGCPDRALGVGLGGHGRTPHRHDGVADELLDGAAVALDHGGGGLEVRRQQLPDLLRVTRLGQWREPHQVAEQHRAEPTLRHACRSRDSPRAGRGRRPHRGAAVAAELETGRHRLAARGARQRQRGPALAAEAQAVDARSPARGAQLHSPAPPSPTITGA